MSRWERRDGVLREAWDDLGEIGPPRTYTRWDAAGVQTMQRPYTTVENARADADAAAALAAVNGSTIGSRISTVDMPAMQAIIDQTLADLRADPSQEMKDLARAVRRLDRKVQGILDGTD